MDTKEFNEAYERLTPKQKEVLKPFLAGEPEEAIAQMLDCDPSNVRHHIANSCSKFGFANQKGEHFRQRQELVELFAKHRPEWVSTEVVKKYVGQILSSVELESLEGSVALDSAFYVERSLIESPCCEAILQPGCLLRIKAPLQTGKTSLMSRVLNHAKLQGYRTVALNLRDTTPEDLSNLDKFLQWFCTIVTEILGLTHLVDEHWGKSLGNSKIKCRTYFEKYVLPEDNPLALALDEVDRLFPHREIAGEFLGMLRTWHEDAKTRSLWGRLRQVVLHTEVYRQLDINQSPFNAGTEIKLTDLSQNEVLSLAQQYGLGWDIAQVDQLMDMVGGHPYLVKAALEQVRRQDMTLEQLLQTAPTAFGIYRDHLERHWRNLQFNSPMATALKKIVMADTPVAFNSELNLDMAVPLDDLGLVTLQSNGATPRYELYRQYFRTRLGDI
ncbi:MAG TPA: AAA-like domain-containing protein [Coleofasciculaceae cyanobacterium]|jgi:DNA-binding CsgD family transcriptional regulator